jgi:hypothetical protein
VIVVKRHHINFLIYITARKVNFQWDDDEVLFVLDKQTWLDFNIASLLKIKITGRYVAPLGHIILIPTQPVFALST